MSPFKFPGVGVLLLGGAAAFVLNAHGVYCNAHPWAEDCVALAPQPELPEEIQGQTIPIGALGLGLLTAVSTGTLGGTAGSSVRSIGYTIGTSSSYYPLPDLWSLKG